MAEDKKKKREAILFEGKYHAAEPKGSEMFMEGFMEMGKKEALQVARKKKKRVLVNEDEIE